jgi:predicted  nucleic acid-binding Zn-ribbon protein
MSKLIQVLIVLSFTQLASNYHACTKCKTKKNHIIKANKFVWSNEQSILSKDLNDISKIFTWYENEVKDHQNEIEKHEQLKSRYATKLKYKSSNKLEFKRLKLEIGRNNDDLSNHHRAFLKDHKKVASIVNKLKALQKSIKSHDGHDH